ncbi:acetyl-coenzyme A synthetase 2 [Mycoemilia scoparia]|uniref:Acetyl-coenzyme A synthetase 2 n=1 Tax=Mycoemilia scoparia TaxID=417184 RepID=A0A9W7ZWR2_9FUNG|nr:acetyl-coenzyme A synthetase 2 [Mycoemilia scoparia]
MSAMKKIVFVTGNANKLKEVQAILSGLVEINSKNIDRLYNMLCGFEDKSGYALCTFAYCSGPGHDPILFEGKTHGTIVPPRGPTTFGWDPVFQPDGHTQTYAEMEPSLKNTLSHRYKALSAFKEFLDKSKQ